MTVLTRKFSEFVPEAVTSVVGLTNGANAIGPNSGGGGSGGVTQVIIQNNSFTVGQWVRFDEGTNLYVTALATTPQFAEVIGCVIAVSPVLGPQTQFTLQQSGYVTLAQAVFPILIPGQPQFLSDTVAGGMMSTDTVIDGEISRPVFIPDKVNGTNSSGWVLPYRGVIDGGGPDTGSGGTTPTTDSNIVTVTQNGHPFNGGDWVRVDTPTVGPNQVHYVLAIADNLSDSQSVGLVIEKVDANTFKLQFAGYISGTGPIFAPFQDAAAALLVPKTVYYLSSSAAGQLTSVDPGLSGGYSKPLYVSEQTIGTVNTNAGYILPQRPLLAPGNPNQILVTQIGHGFDVCDVLRVDTDNTYTRAQANNVTNTWSVGVVVEVFPPDQFILQINGVTPVFTVANFPAGILANQTYWLSDTIAGGIQPLEPVATTSFTKPIITGLSSGGNAFILSHRADQVAVAPAPPHPIDEVWHNCTAPGTLAVANAWIDVPCLTVTITPVSIASKIMIYLVFNGDRANTNIIYGRLTRNGVPIGLGSASGAQIAANGLFTVFITNQPVLFVDEPMSTAALTYHIQVISPAGNTLYLQSDFINVSTTCSSMIAEEIL